eukprot:3906074-Pleurochrysis_carterae.AAC.1
MNAVGERTRARGLPRLRGGSGSVGVQSGGVGNARYGIPGLGERSAERCASTHAARVQIERLCMRAKRSSALRRFQILYFATIDNTVFIGTIAISMIISISLPIQWRSGILRKMGPAALNWDMGPLNIK